MLSHLYIFNYNLRYRNKVKKKIESGLPTTGSICHILVKGAVDPHYGVIHTCFSWDTEFLYFNVMFNKNISH